MLPLKVSVEIHLLPCLTLVSSHQVFCVGTSGIPFYFFQNSLKTFLVLLLHILHWGLDRESDELHNKEVNGLPINSSCYWITR